MPKVTICGIPGVRIRGEREYGGGHIYTGAGTISRFAQISKAEAMKLAKRLGISRLPQMGYETTLCDKTILENTSGRFSVGQRRGSTPFAGLSGRRRKPRGLGSTAMLTAKRAKDFRDSGNYEVRDETGALIAMMFRDPESREWYEESLPGVPQTHYTERWRGFTQTDALASIARKRR